MGEGLKISEEIYRLAVQSKPELTRGDIYLGILATINVLSDPANRHLWARLAGYMEEDAAINEKQWLQVW